MRNHRISGQIIHFYFQTTPLMYPSTTFFLYFSLFLWFRHSRSACDEKTVDTGAMKLRVHDPAFVAEQRRIANGALLLTTRWLLVFRYGCIEKTWEIQDTPQIARLVGQVMMNHGISE